MASKWPKLPAKAAYLTLSNPQSRNALSLSVLRDLRDQLHQYNTSPVDNKVRLLPPFDPNLLHGFEAAQAQTDPSAVQKYGWLLHSAQWHSARAGLPTVLVLRSAGPVFSAGHDLKELSRLGPAEVRETFALCAEVMTLIRRSPAPVIGVVQGLATAAGAQLALTTDLPVARVETPFRLPGAAIGLPCTSPATAVARRLGAPLAYRMLALAEPVRADQMPAGAIETVVDDEALEKRVKEMVERLAEDTAGMPQALGKWAFWTQLEAHRFRDEEAEDGVDGYEKAMRWAGRVMALHARSDDAAEGIGAFLEKRSPAWKT
ncbi:uncharacterized protein JN550_001552 [Neoarthrinium moseri]|uniref:uncharacterized protein n=1 Tax=Neoarthrinium moseri TaxID=1658444 RepID=UPI001FDCE01B|nr:uncharacterized protein JN550_001552 [Neoarthrinium moseri]KAI1876056.1 hypothetical protein JN550_001552 [Neoarthrinium moseri]